MKYLNPTELPDSVVWMLGTSDDYQPVENGIGVTTLIDSVRIRMLTEKYKEHLIEDIRASVFLALGRGIHSLLEGYNKGVIEERLYANIGGMTVAGIPDLIEDHHIYDYKVTRAYMDKLYGQENTRWDHYRKQLACYRYLAHENGYDVYSHSIVAFFRDAREEPLVKEYVLPIEPLKETRDYMERRVAAHMVPEIPLCSDEERWTSHGKWAVKKKGSSRATKLFDSEEQARDWESRGYEVEKRPDRYRRCEKYCGVAYWCDQYDPL